MCNRAQQLFELGWCRFDHDAELATWIEAALPAARATLTDPQYAQWHRYQNTWFAGVNALPNDAAGAVGASGPVRGEAVLASAYRVTARKTDLTVWYSDSNEWLGLESVAKGGRIIRYELT